MKELKTVKVIPYKGCKIYIQRYCEEGIEKLQAEVSEEEGDSTTFCDFDCTLSELIQVAKDYVDNKDWS